MGYTTHVFPYMILIRYVTRENFQLHLLYVKLWIPFFFVTNGMYAIKSSYIFCFYIWELSDDGRMDWLIYVEAAQWS